MLRRTCWLLIACLLLAPAAAQADPTPRDAIALARSRLAALNYEDALRLLDAAWRRGGSDIALAGTIAALAARAAASLDDTAAARRWYRQWLCIDPRAALPDGTSPALQAAFDAARAELGAHWLRARAERGDDAVTVTVLDDPCMQATAVRDRDRRVALRDGIATLARSDAGALELVDDYGNTLATVAVVAALAPHRAWYGRPTAWGIAGGTALLLGAASLYVAIDARSQLRSLAASSAAEDAYYEDSAAPSLQERFDRANVAGSLLVGAAAVASAVAIVLWIRAPARPLHVRVGAGAIGWGVVF